MKNARTSHSEHFSVRVGLLPTPDSPSRLAVVVASSVIRQASGRNTLKRRVRGVLRAELPGMKNGLALAFFAKKGAGKLGFAQIEEEVGSLLRKMGVVVL